MDIAVVFTSRYQYVINILHQNANNFCTLSSLVKPLEYLTGLAVSKPGNCYQLTRTSQFWKCVKHGIVISIFQDEIKQKEDLHDEKVEEVKTKQPTFQEKEKTYRSTEQEYETNKKSLVGKICLNIIFSNIMKRIYQQ